MPERDGRHRIIRAAGLDSEFARSQDDWPPARGLRDSQPLRPWQDPETGDFLERVARMPLGITIPDEPPAGLSGTGAPTPPADPQPTAPMPGRFSPPFPAGHPSPPPDMSRRAAITLLILALLELAVLFALFGPLAARPQ